MAYLIGAHPAYCKDLGCPSLGHIPGIWSKDWTPEVEAIDYLVAKGTGRWFFDNLKSSYGTRVVLSSNSMLAFGQDLTNFLDWCDWRRVNWRELSHGQLTEKYQGDMTSGRWSRLHKGKALSPSTINRRMGTVVDFQRFAAHHGYRGPFKVETRDVLTPRYDPRRRNAEQRVGKVRQHPTYLRLPTMEEIASWLTELKATRGRTAYFLAKTAVGIGLRPQEVLLLRREQVPDLPTKQAKTAKMEICYGTKGGRDPQDPEKRGKKRIVRVPIELLKDLHDYITGHRKLCLRRFEQINPLDPAPKELFLSKYTGRPLGYDRFYEMWKSPKSLPFKAFSPHLARHIWACYTLVEKNHEQNELIRGTHGSLSSISDQLHETLIRTWISPQLGHVDDRTSGMYLV